MNKAPAWISSAIALCRALAHLLPWLRQRLQQ